MSDRLRAFLDDLGLSEYYAALAAERIEPRDIALLTDADLAGLGLPLGPRRRLSQAAAGGADRRAAGAPVRERRNLTVLFCDMVDSTSVASRIDPEDLRIRFRDFRVACEAAIEAEDGFVAHRMGDGLMAHFGFPAALEDAALCAVRAGLEIVARAARLDTPGGAVAVRVGIASGLTVIEEAPHGGGDPDEIATGATLAMAARLQALAGPGEVVVSDATRQLLRNAIALQPMGLKALKGFPEKEAVWLAIGPLADPIMDGKSPLRGSLLGREAEQAKLLGLLREVRTGRGGAVVIEGESGIGKSRLLGELRRAAPAQTDVIALQCHRHRHGATLHPVTEWLESVLKRDAAITDIADLPGVTAATAPPIARIMGLAGDVADAEADQVELQAAIVEAVVSMLAATAAPTRLVLVEDLHWADSVTLEVLERLADRVRDFPVLVAATTRPQVAALPGGFDRITLSPLPHGAIETLIAGQDGADDLSQAVRRTIAERSGGVPLFAEELTRAVLEAPGADSDAVPFTLQDTLMARLDRLGAGKPVAQIGALLGPGFKPDLLAACADMSSAQLDTGLAELVAANLVELRPGHEKAYTFRHALVRDVAYASLLRSRRSALHRRVAETLEARFPELAAAQPERVAHHYASADAFAAAIPYWERAAELALSKAAPASAIAYFRKALELMARQPGSPERDEREAALRIRLTMPLTITTGFASSETEENLSRMAQLYEVLEPGGAVLQLLWSRSMSALVRADLVSARKTAQQLGSAADRAQAPNAPRMPQRILGYIAMLEGELDTAEMHFNRALNGYAPEAFDPILPGHPFDVLAASLSQHAILMALRDRTDAVDSDQERALQRARAFDNPATSFQVLVHLCLARFELDDHDGVRPLLVDLRELVDRHEVAPLYVKIWESWLTARDGTLDEGLAAMARAQKDATQYPLWLPRMSLLRVDLLAGAGRADQALTLLDACDSDIEKYRHTYLLAEAGRLRARCRAALGADRSEVEDLLCDAVTIANRQGARRFERAARQDLDLVRRGRTLV